MLHVKTMLGIGDAFAARPTIAALSRKDKSLWVETSWPEVFSDIRVRGFLRPSNVNIRCAARNIKESKMYAEWGPSLLHTGHRIQLSYSLHKGCKSIPEQIAESAGVSCYGEWDSFFIQPEYHPKGPLAVFRLPTIRTEYHNVARNPAPGLVAEAVDQIGGDWIHINDGQPFDGRERIDLRDAEAQCAPCAQASVGQLSIPTCLDLVARARCVVTPVSWMLWAAAAYQVPTLAIWGGFCSPETIMGPFISAGMCDSVKFVTPSKECWCYNPKHTCEKAIPVERVREAAREMVK